MHRAAASTDAASVSEAENVEEHHSSAHDESCVSRVRQVGSRQGTCESSARIKSSRQRLLSARSHTNRRKSGTAGPSPAWARCSTSRLYLASDTPVHSPSTRLVSMRQRSRSVAATSFGGVRLSPRPSTCPRADALRCAAAIDRDFVARSGAPGRGSIYRSFASALVADNGFPSRPFLQTSSA